MQGWTANVVLSDIERQQESAIAAKRPIREMPASLGKSFAEGMKVTEQSKPKRLTRADVLTVVFVGVCVCLLSVPILVPAYYNARTKSIRFRCGRNLMDMSKTMQIYAGDNEGEFPRAGGKNTEWSARTQDWLADNRFVAYGLNADGTGGSGNITSCLYLLIKYADAAPEYFVCPGDKGTKEFKPADYGAGEKELAGLWDFGAEPTVHCSYSYHMPYGSWHHGPNLHVYSGQFALTTSSESGMAVAADRNPWIDSPDEKAKDPALMYAFNPGGGRKAVKIGNAVAHQEDGQNVLFVDGHVAFEKRPCCGIDDDNIYTYWDGGLITQGSCPVPGRTPSDRLDSLLMNDGEVADDE
jgi:prepilin-type processing-associated H-X9-DG protein